LSIFSSFLGLLVLFNRMYLLFNLPVYFRFFLIVKFNFCFTCSFILDFFVVKHDFCFICPSISKFYSARSNFFFTYPSISNFFSRGLKIIAIGNKSSKKFWKKSFTLGGKVNILKKHILEKCNVHTQCVLALNCRCLIYFGRKFCLIWS
jgi:hypothetical protein